MTVLDALHALPGRGRHIVIAQQMKDAVDGVAKQFRLPGCAKAPRLADRFIHADEDFPVDCSSG